MKNLKQIIVGASLMIVAVLGMSCQIENRVDVIYTAPSKVVLTPEGGEVKVKVYFTQDWEASFTQDWITVSPMKHTAIKPNILDSVWVTVTAPINTTGKERVQTLTFSAKNAMNQIPVVQGELKPQS